MTTPARTHSRALSTFDARSRQILTNGGTVVGGNGATYKYDPLTSTAIVVKWGAPKAAAPRPAPVAPTATTAQPNRPTKGPMSPAERVGADVADAPVGDDRDRDAKARILSVLAEYGLESLADFVWKQILEGRSDAEVLQDIRNTPEFKKRFPAIEERNKAGLAPISPGEYVAYERQARQIMRAAGLPESFYDTAEDFRTFLSGDVSISELNDRIQLGRQAVYDAPQDVRDALARDYGMSEGALTAYFLDPNRATPLLEKQYRAAQIGGTAIRTGFGGTTRAQNEELATLGITAQQAEQGFTTLANSRELFTSIDPTEDAISQDEQLGAAFRGNSAAQRRIEQRRRKRQAVFEAGGSFAAGQGGVSGLGNTNR